MVRSDHRVERAAHGADEDGVGREWASETRLTRDRSEEDVVLAAKAAAIAGMRVERTERDARRFDAEPVAQSLARDPGRVEDHLAREQARHVSERDVRGGEDDPKRVGHAARRTRGG